MIYALTFTSSILMFYFALNFRESNKKLFKILSFIAIMIPCLIAGLRDYSIGTDVNLYVNPLFNVSLYFNNFFDYINSTGSEVNDIGYLFLTFISGKLSKDIFWLFFLSEFLIIAPIYKALLNVTKNKKIIICGIFIFFMVLYNLSLNMVRQSIAIAFSMLSFSYFIKGNKPKTFIFLLIALSFHSSSIIMLVTFAFYHFFHKEKTNAKKSFMFEYFVFSIITISIIMLPNILSFLIKIELLDAKHFGRLLENSSKYDINFIRTAWYIIFYFLFLFNKKRFSINISNSQFYNFLSFISIVILQLGAVVQFSERIGYYFFFISLILGVPFLIVDNENKKIKRDYLVLIIFVVFFAYWFYWSIYIGSNQTYPFVFRR